MFWPRSNADAACLGKGGTRLVAALAQRAAAADLLPPTRASSSSFCACQHTMRALFLLWMVGTALWLPSKARAATSGQSMQPDNSFIVRDALGDLVLAPATSWGEGLTLVESRTTEEVEACADACRRDPACNVFDHCDTQGGCDSALPHLAYKECRLLAMNCTAQPQVGVIGPWVKRSAGFPVRYTPPDVEGFAVSAATGIAGFDLPACAGTVLPGKCAFASAAEAATACSAIEACHSIVIYYNGTDGCSQFVALLASSSAALSSDQFMSPRVGLLNKLDAGQSGDGSSSGNGDGSTLSGGAIFGIAIGSVAAAAGLAVAAWLLLRRRRRRQKPGQLGSSGAVLDMSSLKVADIGKHAEEGFGSNTLYHSGASTPGSRAAQGTSGAHGSGGSAQARGSSGGVQGSGTGQVVSTSSGSGGAQEPALLPELARHIAACDEQSSRAGGGIDAVELSNEPSMLSADSLSPALRVWVADISEVTFLHRPDGGLQELGRGASGVVYKAEFRGEVVAAKQVALDRSTSAQEAFVLEAERLHALRHAHIVALYGVALSGHTGIMLMEYCGGRDLMKALELKSNGTQERLFSWHNRGRRIAYDIAKALNFLHARGVVHLDVKSSNVLLTGSGTAKLADVGLARLMKGAFLSDLAQPIGTFAWIAPEVLLGGQNCTSAVDLYSFGVVLWEIITGEKPLRGHLRTPRVPEECPQAVSDLLMQCMSIDPIARPTAQQVMQRLRLLGNQKADG